jgi:spermidine/putrescine transport system ATP-binding protein
MSYLTLRALCRAYAGKPVLRDLDLEIEEGEFVSLLGASGSGKSTALRLIAGFERPDSGTIELAGAVINDIPAHKRNIGMVFQSYALFPHMTVLDNVAYGLRQRGKDRKRARAEAASALELVQLPGFEDRRPDQLSGGEQQRVALARAIVIKPRLMLLDESLSALDKKLRTEMQVELRRLQRTVGITTVFVTHDQEEALKLSDRVAVLDQGRVQQYGPPSVVYEAPATAFVAAFLGRATFLSGSITRDVDGRTCLAVGDVAIPVHASATLTTGAPAMIAVRPEKVRISGLADDRHPYPGVVRLVTYAGGVTDYVVDALGAEFQVQSQNTTTTGGVFDTGDRIWFGWDVAAGLVLDATPNA